ncbi:uncharacterized protein [Onthophagus taurus]
MKCPDLILYPSRKCVSTCPFGYKEEWSTKLDLMGRICVPVENLISNYALTILAGIFCGSFICFFIIGSGILYLQYQRKKIMKEQQSETNSDVDDSTSTPERKDFLKQLELLRPYTKTYLQMLNDTRKQLRETIKQDSINSMGDLSATAVYRPVLRDLAKILLLLNRPIQKIAIPDDWEHLLTWAEQALKRYKRMSDISNQPQVAQLINFLQEAPSVLTSSNENNDYVARGSTNMSTFKPERAPGSNLSLNNLSLNNLTSNNGKKSFDGTNFLNPQWKFEYNIIQNSQFNPAQWKNSKEYLNNPYYFDDDFCQLGFRPQDEITTEL